MPRIRTTSKAAEAAPEYEVVYKSESTEYTVYSMDPENGSVSKDGVYPTWKAAYDTLGDGGARVRGSSNNFVFDGKTLRQIYKYKNTGRTGKWSGNGYDVIWSTEISEDPKQYIRDHFTATNWTSCEFNEKSESSYEKLEYEKGHKNSKGRRNEGRKKAEGYEGWGGWEEVEGLEDAIEGIENLAYELRHCIRGAKTQCKDWKALALYIKGLASNLDDAAELMAYKTDSDNDDESANESDNPIGELFDDLKQALAGKGYKVSQFTSDKEFVGQRKAYDGISIENEDPNAYHKNPYRIVLDTDDNLFRIFFPHARRKSVTGQPGSISGIVKFILRDLNLDRVIYI